MTKQVKVPDVGDAEEIEVIEILVSEGDTVKQEDSLIVLESDKASMEVPSPFAGKVVSIAVSEGDKVDEGDLILELETDEAEEGEDEKDEEQTGQAKDEAEKEEKEEKEEGEEKEEDKENKEKEEDEKAGKKEKAPDKEEEEADEKETADEEKAEKKEKEADKKEDEKADEEEREELVKVPDVGDAKDITVTEILVSVGDEIETDESLVVLESDKASMEIPSPHSGTVIEILVSEGDEVNEGTDLLKMKVSGRGKAAPAREEEAGEEKPSEPSRGKGAEKEKRDAGEKREPAEKSDERETERGEAPGKKAEEDADVYAGPAVRKQAREYGVDLTEVDGSGRKGRILKEDVQAHVKERLSDEGGGALPKIPAVDFSRYGETDLEPMSRVRKVSARNLHRSWVNVPHVTQHDEADITELETFRKAQNEELSKQGKKLTPLAFLVKACTHALAKFPHLNSSLDEDLENFVIKRYYHIGIAVDTEDGLVVPVLRDADKKGVIQIADESADLAAKARDKKLPLDAMQGATFTISSLGGIGGTAFTPIVNAPEVAILGVSRAKITPVYDGKAFQPRTMLPLSLSYDHRAIDGAEAARFTVYLASVLSDVRRLIL